MIRSDDRKVVMGWIALWAALLGSAYRAEAQVIFPADSGVLDVTAFGATPDDGIDDTAAIQALLDANPSNNKVFYFPDGVYDLSDTLAPANDDGVTKRNIFQGQSEGGAVLKLQDHLGFTGAVIDYNANASGGAPPAQFFRNAVRNLTVDIGVGNPQATGVRFNASNQGTVRDVTIRSGDGSGGTGLIMGSAEPGPLLLQNITIDGFDTGLRTLLPTASQTVEHVTLRNQNVVGWANDVTQQVFGRGVDFEGDARAIDNRDQSRMLLVDSKLTGLSPTAFEAIRNNKKMYLRDVETSGYNTAVNNGGVVNLGRGNLRNGSDDRHIVEFWANGAYDSSGGTARRGGAYELFDSPDTSLRLPVKEHPTLPYAPLAEWTGPQHHQIDLGGGQISGLPNDGIDDTAAIQAAINAGASTVYLPNGTWQIDGTVQLGNNVERLLGAEARIVGDGVIRVTDGGPDTVFIERLENAPVIQHNTSRTLVLEHLLGFDYQVLSATPGDVFLNDVVGGAVEFSSGQNVWARQLNLESRADATNPDLPDAKVVNRGANVWILGFKTEDSGTWIKTVDGGKTELLGGVKVGSGETFGADNAMFVTEESSLFAALPLIAAGEGYEYVAKEVRNGQTLAALSGSTFNLSDVYTAFAAEAIRDREVIIDNDDAGVTLTGAWTETDSFPGGFIDEDFLFAEPVSGNTATFSPDLPEDASYEVFVRWVSDRSGQDHSGHASEATFTVHAEDGSHDVTVDMTDGGGYWHSLGVFDLTGTAADSVVLDAATANGRVIADALRFLRIASLAGDYNGDGSVDGADYTFWANRFGLTTPDGLLADGNGDGMVDGADYTFWANRFAAASGLTLQQIASAYPVPEPGSLGLLAVLATGVYGSRRAPGGRAR